ncbi:hypothetical protein BU251_03695 [Candidatus Velamenicoccus archaeovorus]|uniref:Uncharacterized protein n=1 Tax=Velamenicoccus archaeovorus TaxID=1930593 RepID=A0A410P4A2_VELA1|nr:hypothetical protein BU251_03695 [Candidatus Velamenicoccus archaeovorus]
MVGSPVFLCVLSAFAQPPWTGQRASGGKTTGVNLWMPAGCQPARSRRKPDEMPFDRWKTDRHHGSPLGKAEGCKAVGLHLAFYPVRKPCPWAGCFKAEARRKSPLSAFSLERLAVLF